MNFFRVFLLIFVPVASALAGDSASPRLTVADAVREAMAKNPGIEEAQSQWDAARERVTTEGAWDDLQVSAMSRLARFIAIPRNAFADQTVSVTQMIPVTGKNLWRARAAAAEARMAYEELRRRQLDVAAQTRTAYYRLANAQAQVEFNRRDLALLQQVADTSRLRYEAGARSAADVLTAETEAGKLLDSAKDLERGAVAGQTQLNVLMGRDAFAPIGEVDEEPVKEIDLQPASLRAVMFANRPEIRSAEDRVEAERARLELARRAWIPDPALTLEGQRYNGAGQGISEVDAGISFNIPWTNGPKYSAGVRGAADTLAAAGHALDAAREEALGQLRTAMEEAEIAQHHEHLSRGPLLEEASEGVKASEIGYQAGQVTLAEWIMAAHNLLGLQAMQREEAGDYQVAIAQLEAVIGAPVTETSTKGNDQ